MGDVAVRSWLQSRLAGEDSLLPLDRLSGEDPEARIVGLLRDAGPLAPVSRAIGRASARLLGEAEKAAPAETAWLDHLLRLCQQVPIADTHDWFASFVQRLAGEAAAIQASWPTAVVREIVLAAVQQARAMPGSAVHQAWERLLRAPAYATPALIALGTSFQVEIAYLPIWWKACPAGERPRELRQRLQRAWKQEGDEKVFQTLAARWPVLPDGLRTAIDVVLHKLGLPRIESHRETRMRRAFDNAALRGDLVLAAEAMNYPAAHA